MDGSHPAATGFREAMSGISYYFQLSMDWFKTIILTSGIYQTLIFHVARASLVCEITGLLIIKGLHYDFHRAMEF